MQTFLPYADFKKSAMCLDNKRLGKQRVEAWQLYLSLTESNYGWKQHPASKMWRGYEQALIYYGIVICNEWRARGFRDSMSEKFFSKVTTTNPKLPQWLGNPEFHLSHQSNLLRKNKEYYGPRFENIPSNLPYVWPV